LTPPSPCRWTQSADILIADVKALREVIAQKAREQQFTAMIGRSHGIHAEPTTFGLKMAVMHDEFGRALRRLESGAAKRWPSGSSPAPSAPARIFAGGRGAGLPRSWGCVPRRSPPRWCSAICTPSL
jgi:hypothetical protein